MTLLAQRMKRRERNERLTPPAAKAAVAEIAADRVTDVHRAYRDALARAYRSVGTTQRDRAAWLLRFAVGELDPSSLDRIAAEVEAFIASALDAPDSPLPLNAMMFTPGVAERIHREWKAAMGALRNTGSALSPGPIRYHLDWQRRSGLCWVGAGQSDALGVFFVVAFQLLTKTGLRSCEWARCATQFFVPSRTDQTYCSKKCRDAAAQARTRREPSDRRSDRRHKKYARQVRKRTPNAVIQRRPSKSK
jgi:hypothetical protein